MRMFMRVKFDVEAANRAIKDGSIGKIIEDFANAFKPEGMWFVSQDGKRCMVTVFDLPSTAKIPGWPNPSSWAWGRASKRPRPWISRT